MLTILVPVTPETDAYLPGFISTIEHCTDVPMQVIIHGSGSKQDLGCAEVMARLSNVHAVFDRKRYSFVDATSKMVSAMSKDSSDIVVVSCPKVRLNDKRWFGKIQRVFEVDQRALVVTTDTNRRESTLAPCRRARTAEPSGGDLTAFRLAGGTVNSMTLEGADDVPTALHREAFKNGCYSWHHPGIRYHRIACPESLEGQAR